MLLSDMNIHHLELFFYVAKHGGISKALRHIPYGIQQPAVSGQMLQLEESLGLRLFERTPFSLTPQGKELFTYIQPFFEGLDPLESKLRQSSAPMLRIAASDLVLRDHLPSLFSDLRKTQPGLRFELRSGYQQQMVAWVQDREVDVAICPVEGKPPARCKHLLLAEIAPVLLVAKNSPWQSASELWSLKRLAEPLIALPEEEVLSRLFQKGLKALGVVWPTAIAAGSLETISTYVSNGYGIGLSVDAPEVVGGLKGVRVLPLPHFEPLRLMALWTGGGNAASELVLETLMHKAERRRKG